MNTKFIALIAILFAVPAVGQINIKATANGQVRIGSTTANGVTSITPGTNVTCTPFASGTCVGAITVNATDPLNTKGDIFTFGTANARLPVGTNGQVLTSNSAATLGVDWEAPTSGISLLTDGVVNSTQTLLNLAAGPGISLVNVAGTTTVNATSTGCGPVTGDATSTNCGNGNRTGDTATIPANVQTFGYDLMDANSQTNVVAAGSSSGTGSSAYQLINLGYNNGLYFSSNNYGGQPAHDIEFLGNSNFAAGTSASPCYLSSYVYLMGYGNMNGTCSSASSNPAGAVVSIGDGNMNVNGPNQISYGGIVALGEDNLWQTGTGITSGAIGNLVATVALGYHNFSYYGVDALSDNADNVAIGDTNSNGFQFAQGVVPTIGESVAVGDQNLPDLPDQSYYNVGIGAFNGGAGPPIPVSYVVSSTGGSLGPGNHYARVVAVDYLGATHSIPFIENYATISSGTTNEITWSWSAHAIAASYRVYVGTTPGGENSYFSVSASSSPSFTQTTASGTAGTVPASTDVAEDNVWIGENTGAIGTNTVAIGEGALGSWAAGTPPSAVRYSNYGVSNYAIGLDALAANVLGSYNIGIGDYAGCVGCANNTIGNANYNGSHNVWIGDTAGPNTTTQLSYDVAIGYQAYNTAPNQTVIGGTQTTQTILNGITAHPTQAAIASAATIAPTAQVFHVTGTAAISTITPPAGCTTSGYACALTIIPDGLWTTVAGGNIAVGTTAVVNKALIETYDPGTSLWYPSY